MATAGGGMEILRAWKKTNAWKKALRYAVKVSGARSLGRPSSGRPHSHDIRQFSDTVQLVVNPGLPGTRPSTSRVFGFALARPRPPAGRCSWFCRPPPLLVPPFSSLSFHDWIGWEREGLRPAARYGAAPSYSRRRDTLSPFLSSKKKKVEGAEAGNRRALFTV